MLFDSRREFGRGRHGKCLPNSACRFRPTSTKMFSVARLVARSTLATTRSSIIAPSFNNATLRITATRSVASTATRYDGSYSERPSKLFGTPEPRKTPTRGLFLGNIPPDTKEEEIRELLHDFPGITVIRIGESLRLFNLTTVSLLTINSF